MPLECLAANLNSNDLTQLVQSKMIQIKYFPKKDVKLFSVARIITIPESLACLASKKLKHLCFASSRVFTADDILGEPVADFEARLIAGDFYTHMSSFAKWCYGADLDNEDGWCCDRWYLGQKIGSPKFQNANLRLLCSSPNNETEWTGQMLKDTIDSATLKKVWNQADFSVDVAEGSYLEDDYEVYWEKKKLLNFVLDLIVYGTDSWDIGNALKAGGHLAIQLGMKMSAKIRAGGLNSPPWLEENFDNYLMDENGEDEDEST